MNTMTHPAVADLPETEVEEIIEDIGQHISEVATELGEEVSVEALAGRLGTPEQYASELRAAAGYSPAGPAAPVRAGRFVARIALWSLIIGSAITFLTGLASTPRLGDSPAGPIVVFGLLPLLMLVVLLWFGPDGKPLPEVYLYDQYGQPITTWEGTCGRPSTANNKFPHPRIDYDATGCHERSEVPFTAAIPR